MIYFCNIPQTIMITKLWGDLNAVIKILTVCNISGSIAVCKLISFWYQRNENDYNLLLDNNISKTFRPLLVNGYFSYDVQSSPYYEIIFICQFFSILFAATAYSSVDAFFAVLIFHLCGQLTNLKNHLIRLPKETSTDRNDTFLKTLSIIVLKHEYLERFANTIEDSFNLMFLLQMIMSSFVLCLQGYQLIMITTDSTISIIDLIFMIYFTLCVSFSLFLYCYLAEILKNKSLEIGDAVYESDWYHLPYFKSKDLLLLMVRAKQPFKITAGKFTRMMFHVWDNFQVLMEILTSANLLTILACVRLFGLWYYKEGIFQG
ncbi:PREDICTED: odorant receptor 13a-like [Ceratosolen solmsi marchali]|uniref:Odorant receptor 13a-like n=1 Tax=Ceratosolen solmsi marchali TaxID=326594 RepID=A0AAJ7DXX3_9HYME|nr:PREDICTED: odorant receptor 13a-like [Ceratosolen solmsi marchali]